LRIVVLIDGEQGVKPRDIDLFEMLCSMNKVFNVTPQQIVLTKTDRRCPALESFSSLAEKYPLLANYIFATSAKTGFGVNELRAYLTYLLYREKIHK
jgi:selenocysteine-specific translation elongation factor